MLVTKPKNINNNKKLKNLTHNEERNLAYMRDIFREQDNYTIRQVLKNDLMNFMDGFDIGRMKLVTLDFFVPAFLGKICNVYDTPPLLKVPKDQRGDSVLELLKEVNLIPSLTEAFERMRLHNTVMAHIKYNEALDKLVIDSRFNASNTYVCTNASDSLEWQALAYEYKTIKDKTTWVVWDRETLEHYYIVTDNKFPEFTEEDRFTNDRLPIEGNDDFIGPIYGEGEMPWVVYRNQNHGNRFWGNGMDSLIELVETINILLTVANDDTIQETIRLLILNFTPSGTAGDEGQIKSGLRHPIFPDNSLLDASPDAKVLSADLYNDEVYKMVEQLGNFVSNLHNVDSPLKTAVEQNLSGIAIKLRTEPLLRQWASDINRLRSPDLELIKKVVLVNNYHRDEQIDVSILDEMVFDYQEPKIVTDEKVAYDLERMKWEDGTSSPVRWLLKNHPEQDEDWALEYIRNNKEVMEELNPKEEEKATLPTFNLRNKPSK